MIAFQSSRDDLINRTSEIYVMSGDGTNQTQLTFNTWSDNTPTWSPDGNKILFSAKQNGENYDLYVMDANGANISALTQNNNNHHNPEWSPDGTMIAFSSNRDGDYEIYVMNANGTNIQQLTHNTDYDGEPTWWLPPPTTLTTTLTLGGRGTPPNAVHSIPLTADLYQNGVLVTPHIPTTTTAGAFTLPNIAQGLYTLWVKPAQYLAVAPTVNLNAPAVSLDAGTLKAGDADNSNLINISDFSILSTSFGKVPGQTGYDARADFDGNNLVNVSDYSLLATNFNQVGAPRPTPPPPGSLAIVSSPQVAPTGDAALVLSPSRGTIQAGTTFDVRVQVRRNLASVDAVELHLAFDPALLQVEAITPTRFLPYVLQNAYDNSAGTIDYAAGALEEIHAGRFNTVTIRFRALSPSEGLTLAVNDANVTFGGVSVYGGATVTGVTVR